MESQVSKLENSEFSPSPRPSEPLRVLVDARKLGHGGIGVYIDNMVAGLLGEGGARVSLIASKEKASSYCWHSEVDIIEDPAKPYSLDEHFGLPRRIDFSRFDLFHSPHFTLPFGIPLPTVVTLHDLIHIYHPEKKYYPWVAGPMIRSALARATRVIAVSRSTGDDIRRFARSSSKICSKVRIVPNALDPCFLPQPENPEVLGTRFHLRGRYLLGVFSMLKPHKGVSDLLAAYKQAQERLSEKGLDVKLALVGQGTERMVENDPLFEAASKIKGVHILGSVSKQDLATLYAGALALVVPSHAEGFCLPVLEAQAMGTPVIARPVPAISEILCERDVRCRDFSIEELRNSIVAFLSGPRALGSATGQTSKLYRFSREDVGRTVMRVYREAVDERGGVN